MCTVVVSVLFGKCLHYCGEYITNICKVGALCGECVTYIYIKWVHCYDECITNICHNQNILQL